MQAYLILSRKLILKMILKIIDTVYELGYHPCP